MPRRSEPPPNRPSARERALEAEIALQRLEIAQIKDELEQALSRRNHAESVAKKVADTLAKKKKEMEAKKKTCRRKKEAEGQECVDSRHRGA